MRQGFEGWYFKQQAEDCAIAVIPALHVNERGEASASLQIITEQFAHFISYDEGLMQIDRHELRIKLGGSCFSLDGIHLDVCSGDIEAVGDLRFGALTRPRYDIMGPFCCVPYMECRHSVFSIAHTVSGALRLNGREMNFDGGTGYIEGDRGYSFPRRYMWTQCSFGEGSLMLSVAEIPFMGSSFTGVTGFVYHQGRERRLATYLGAKVAHLGSGKAVIRQGKYELSAELLGGDHRLLRAPVRGQMSRFIRENFCCRVHYRFSEAGRTILDFVSDRASFENEY